jgi:hypothetical protein
MSDSISAVWAAANASAASSLDGPLLKGKLRHRRSTSLFAYESELAIPLR